MKELNIGIKENSTTNQSTEGTQLVQSKSVPKLLILFHKFKMVSNIDHSNDFTTISTTELVLEMAYLK